MRTLLAISIVIICGCSKPNKTTKASAPDLRPIGYVQAQTLELGGNPYCIEKSKGGERGWPARKDGICYQEDAPLEIELPIAPGEECNNAMNRADGARCFGGFWYVRENAKR